MAALLAIPQNFLLLEREARQVDNQETWSKISNSLRRPLLLNPCERKRTPADGRIAARQVDMSSSAPSWYGEQLVVYPDSRQAAAAVRRVRADLKRCAVFKVPKSKRAESYPAFRYKAAEVRVGDDAVLVRSEAYVRDVKSWTGWEHYVLARRGSAVMVYQLSDAAVNSEAQGRRQVVRWARAMAGKACGLALPELPQGPC
ncbi:hypothetical protein [Thermoactinospora rubra]|uniref:hypothetical protein n=1 Tax=Thermoactinospora rubra TaxID=1088767 RepID=UPI001301C7B2|nr:hypothetical protein [Thermoactinospora rubra]